MIARSYFGKIVCRILRRMKKDVLAQLPEKHESVEMIDLLPEQKALYASYLAKLKHDELKHLDRYWDAAFVLAWKGEKRYECNVGERGHRGNGVIHEAGSDHLCHGQSNS